MRSVFILALAACSVPQPSNETAAAPAGADAAADLVVAAWAARLEAELGAPPAVRWFAGECLAYDTDYPHCIRGAYWCGYFELHLVWRDRPSDSELVHELLRGALEPECDGLHEGPRWAEVDAVRAELRGAGL